LTILGRRGGDSLRTVTVVDYQTSWLLARSN
jgi:hypothetical protein